MDDVFASPNGKFQAVLHIEQCDSTISFNLRADDSSHRQTESLSIERQRSFYIVHPMVMRGFTLSPRSRPRA
jgi:hypothetical protein